MIRKATIHDISRIAEILVFSKRMTYRTIFHNDQVTFNVITVAGVLKEYRDHPEKYRNIRIWDDGIIKGMLHYEMDGTKMELVELYVDPFFTGSGIGSALLQDFLSMAKLKGIETVSLWVIKDNEAARDFYERHGFVYVNEERYVEDTTIREMRYRIRL